MPTTHTVRNQRELDAAFELIDRSTERDHVIVVEPGPTDYAAFHMSNRTHRVEVLSGVVHAEGCSMVYARGDSIVYARGTSVVVGREDAHLFTFGHALATVFDHVTIHAAGSSTVSAQGRSRVVASAQASVDLDDEAHATARDRARVYAKGNSTATLRDFTQARAMGRSLLHVHGAGHDIIASDQAQVYLYDVAPSDVTSLQVIHPDQLFAVDRYTQVGASRG